MPRDNEVDEISRLKITAHSAGIWSAHEHERGGFVLYTDHAATVAELRAEVESLREILIATTNPDGSPNLLATQVGAAETYRLAAINENRRADAAERRVGEAISKLNAMELMAREAGFAEGIGGIEGKDLTALKAMFIRLADHLEDARNALTGADPT